jgi:hypothetical protein
VLTPAWSTRLLELQRPCACNLFLCNQRRRRRRNCWDYLYKSGRSCDNRKVCTTTGQTAARTAYCLGRWLLPNLFYANKTEDPGLWVNTATGCSAYYRGLAEDLQHY